MAAPIIKIKRSSVPGKIPTTASLPVGEFGINTYDGKVYIQQDQGGVGVGSTVIVVNPWSVGLGSNTYNTYFNAGNVGIGTTNPTSKLHVVGNVNISGILTATGGFNLGISSAGTSITSGPVTRLNFIGAGNTFAVNGTTVDISIVGGGGASVSISTEAPADPTEGDLWYSSLLGRTFIYYVDDNSSQWVDAAPFNQSILDNVSGIGFASGSASNLSIYSTDYPTTGLFFPSSTEITLVSSGSSILNVNSSGVNVSGIITATSFSGALTGTATTLQTARTIGGVSFNGSANIDLPGVNTAGNQNTSGSAATLTTGRTIAITGDLTYTSGSFNGSGNVTGTGTLATVNSNVGTFGSSTAIPSITVNAKGLVTGVTTSSITTGLSITNNTSTNSIFYPTFTSATSGSISGVNISSTKLQFNPSTGAVGIGTAIDIVPYDNLNSGTLSFEGSAGQLFSITNNLTSGSIFSVNDVSGIPSIDVDANGTIELAPFGGNVGVGLTNPTTKLHVNGTITCTDINSTSDASLKDNIQTFENALDTIQEIRGVRFDWKDNQKPSVGVVAQEIEKVLPELVTDTDPKTVNYNGLIGVLIQAIKEQQIQINTLKEQIEDLKNER